MNVCKVASAATAIAARALLDKLIAEAPSPSLPSRSTADRSSKPPAKPGTYLSTCSRPNGRRSTVSSNATRAHDDMSSRKATTCPTASTSSSPSSTPSHTASITSDHRTPSTCKLPPSNSNHSAADAPCRTICAEPGQDLASVGFRGYAPPSAEATSFTMDLATLKPNPSYEKSMLLVIPPILETDGHTIRFDADFSNNLEAYLREFEAVTVICPLAQARSSFPDVRCGDDIPWRRTSEGRHPATALPRRPISA